METYHVPVLLTESCDLMGIADGGVYVDLTFGGGGHTREILRRMGPKSHLFSFDRDSDTTANLPDDSRFTFIQNNFRFMRGCLRSEGAEQVDAILADLGVSSHHFDEAERGFSYRFDAPLDMRMNQHSKFSAKELLNEYPQELIEKILRQYGELRESGRIAKAIIKYRETSPLVTINDLLSILEPCISRGTDRNKFLAQVFQAIRIEVNGELDALKMMLEQSSRVLRPGGRLVIITYHSLEDRLVKNFMRNGNFDGIPQKDFFGRVETPFEVYNNKPIVPNAEEMERNSRSRSAKLRCAIKL